jgi:hypothetical protein
MPIADALPQEQAGPAATAACRRLCVRHVADVATVCQPVASWTTDQLKWQAQIRDVSFTGIALVLPRRFDRGTGLAVEVPGPDADSSHTIFAKIVRVVEEPDGSWLVGCVFVSELSDAELQALVGAVPAEEDDLPTEAAAAAAPAGAAPTPAPATAEGRPAASVVEFVRLRCVLDGGQAVGRRVRRLHVNGPWPLCPGSTVRAWAGKGAPRGLKLSPRVLACERKGRGWVLTCELDGVSPEEARRWLDITD